MNATKIIAKTQALKTAIAEWEMDGESDIILEAVLIEEGLMTADEAILSIEDVTVAPTGIVIIRTLEVAFESGRVLSIVA